MERYEKPQMEIIILPEDIITTSCRSICGTGPNQPIETPDL